MNSFFGKLLDDKRGLMIFSLIVAIIGWLAVVNSIDKQTEKDFVNIPVNPTALEEDLLTPLNLNIVNEDAVRTRVTIQGDGNIIGGLSDEDILIYADLTGIDAPGIYDAVPLVGRDVNLKGFAIKSIQPKTISLRVDRMTTKTFPITADVTGLLIPDGYLGRTPILNPKEVSITGPDSEIQQIERCVAVVDFTEPLEKSTSVRSDILLFDTQGNLLPSSFLTLSSTQTDITVPVYVKKLLPVTFEYLNVPKNFHTSELPYTLSVTELSVAGAADQLDNLDSINIGYVDVTEIQADSVFSFEVSLPTGILNLDSVSLVDLTFDLPDLQQAVFTIPQENISITNASLKYQITVESRNVPDVTIVGNAAVLENLVAGDIVAEVDLSEREITVGSNDMPVRLFLPKGGFAWATGRYSAVVNIKVRESVVANAGSSVP